jgi:hypothetical protein
MSNTDHGSQTISHAYYEEITALNRNARFKGIIPVGIYSGGLLTKVSNIEITLSPMIAEISDGTSQIRVKTASAATINDSTLDSGTVSSSTPYIVLRWSYAAMVTNFVEIHAIASVSSAGANDIIVGKVNFSGSVITGFDYSDRTFTKSHDMFLKPEAYTGMYILLNAGVIHTNTGHVFVSTRVVGPFTVPTSPNSRIDLVYINDSGSPTILQGVAAPSPVAPSYDGKLVVAEVTIVNGDTSITSSMINDVRSFLTPKAAATSSITASQLAIYDSGWFSATTGTNITKSHGLGVVPKFVHVYYSNTADGSGDVVTIGGGTTDYTGSGNTRGVTQVIGVTATSITLRAQHYLTMYYNQSAVHTFPTTGYLKIIAF